MKVEMHSSLVGRGTYDDPAFHDRMRQEFVHWDEYLQNPVLCPDCGKHFQNDDDRPCACF